MAGRIKYLSVALLLCLAEGLSAQSFRTNNYDGNVDQMGNQQPTVGTNPFDTSMYDDPEGQQVEQRDTTPKAPPKPLESYFFDNEIRRQGMFSWSVSMRDNVVEMHPVDTMLSQFQVDMPFQREDVGAAYLGSQPQASIPLNYFRRPDSHTDFVFMRPFEAYIITPEKAPYYNVKRPYTLLEYIQTGNAGTREMDLRVIHAQNINPSTGFNLYFYNPTTKGMYLNQRSADMNLSLGFLHTGKRYSIHGGYIYNYVRTAENGGMQVDSLVGDMNHYEEADVLPIRLQDAQNRSVGNTFYVVQSYGIPLRRLRSDDFTMAEVPAFYIGNSIGYTQWGRTYRDTHANSIWGTDGIEYYDNWYLNNSTTRDTIGESLFTAKAFLQMQPWDRDGVIGTLTAGVGINAHSYAQFRTSDYLTGKLSKDKTTDYYIYGSAAGRFRKYFDWGADAELMTSGQLEANGSIKLSPYLWGHEVALEGTASYRRTPAPYWYENYYSNHYIWDNSFAMENETRFGINFQIPDLGFEVGAQQNVSVNKLYMDATIKPAQFGGTLSVSGIYIREDIKLGAFHFNHRVMLQWSDNQAVAPVPLVSAYASYYAEFDLVRDVLRLKVGVDGRYTTKYNGFGYNPALGMFYNQQEVEVGGYPMLDAYIVMKWKTMRIFFSVQHVNNNWFNLDPTYFTVAHYPQNRRMFKFGVSWDLYN